MTTAIDTQIILATAIREAAKTVVELSEATLTESEAQKQVLAVLEQDPYTRSLRISSFLFSLITLALLVPDVQAFLGEWVPSATIFLTGILSLLSKMKDLRPLVGSVIPEPTVGEK